MRQRVLQATLITVLLSVLMLGIPLAVSWLELTKMKLRSDGLDVAERVRVETDERLAAGEPIDAVLLQNIVDEQEQLNVSIRVAIGDREVSAGPPIRSDDGSIVAGLVGGHGQRITVMIPPGDVRAQTASAWVLIAVAGLASLSIGVSVALWQAQRISSPLARLTRRAEELGSGRARGPWKSSGIAEIDTVADELSRSGALLTERLEAESRLASDASHQLRTPLTALSMRLDEILATSSEEPVREEARIALEQIDRLTSVVHDLINAPAPPSGALPVWWSCGPCSPSRARNGPRRSVPPAASCASRCRAPPPCGDPSAPSPRSSPP
ncbi:histidine kinase dimerization/phospho-acceptor domain-containing protein [Brachybacterium sillae]|uniref:ATP-binding protein n=1 Tax=Brachybacterium sillae TaxID=2810536 RepID=UPI00217E9206|nr:histidine kinase dimerization/phospho-acceptor domain-containing protein [Brachybacterium sillae]